MRIKSPRSPCGATVLRYIEGMTNSTPTAFTITDQRIEPGIQTSDGLVVLGGDLRGQTRAAVLMPSIPDGHALVRISSRGAGRRVADGRALAYWGVPHLIARGRLNRPGNLQLAGWDETLWLLRSGDAVLVQPSDCPSYVLSWDGSTLRCRPVADWILLTVPPWLSSASAQEIDQARATASALPDGARKRLCEALGAQ